MKTVGCLVQDWVVKAGCVNLTFVPRPAGGPTMEHCIIAGCDVHVKSILVMAAGDREAPVRRTFANTQRGRARLVHWLSQWAARLGGAHVLVVYETSSLGYVLYDDVTAAGLECAVVATSRLPRSWKHKTNKTDERDAQLLLELGRSHVLAGNALAAVWVPGPQERDDRELTRAREDLAKKVTRVKAQIQSELKFYGLERPRGTGGSWTKAFWAWLDGLLEAGPLGYGARVKLTTLLAQLRALLDEVAYVDDHLKALAGTERHAAAVAAMVAGFKGVGLRVALTVLTELGDLARFPAREHLASYAGLVPTSHESGEASDRKGHISHQGPPRLRRALCQAVQHWKRFDPSAKRRYDRLVARGGRRAKKIATVALMRRLLLRLWYVARDAQAAAAAGAEATG
jgi:transposase